MTNISVQVPMDVHGLTDQEVAAARRVAAGHATDATDLRNLLDCLGLLGLDGGGRAAPSRVRQHGTEGGYKRHRSLGEEPCEACWAAARAVWTKRRRRVGVQPKPLTPCGTRAAYLRHIAHGEPACGPCRAANAAASRANRRAPHDTLTEEMTR